MEREGGVVVTKKGGKKKPASKFLKSQKTLNNEVVIKMKGADG